MIFLLLFDGRDHGTPFRAVGGNWPPWKYDRSFQRVTEATDQLLAWFFIEGPECEFHDLTK